MKNFTIVLLATTVFLLGVTFFLSSFIAKKTPTKKIPVTPPIAHLSPEKQCRALAFAIVVYNPETSEMETVGTATLYRKNARNTIFLTSAHVLTAEKGRVIKIMDKRNGIA